MRSASNVNADELEAKYRARFYSDLAEAKALTGCGVEDLRRMTCPMFDRVIRTPWEREVRTFKNTAIAAKSRDGYKLAAGSVR